MAVKWIAKTSFAVVIALIIALYPEKAAALLVLIGHALWNIAVMVGEKFHIPGEGKAQAATLMVGLLSAPLSWTGAASNSDQKGNS